MTQQILHPTPAVGGVLIEQLRAAGYALRRPALFAAVLVGLATVMVGYGILGEGATIDFHPEQFVLPGLVGLVLPILVWRGEDRFGSGFLWTLPVDRRLHALLKVLAGWVWLMAGVGGFVLWLLAVAVLSGGAVHAEETVWLLPHFHHPDPSALTAADLRTVSYAPSPLLWLVPFTAATGTYLLASAVALGTRHPARWGAGVLFLLFLLLTAREAMSASWDPYRVVDAVLLGPYGFDTLLTARTEILKVGTTLSTGEQVVVWRDLPDVGEWATATAVWIAAGLIALWAAASRHRERRRA